MSESNIPDPPLRCLCLACGDDFPMWMVLFAGCDEWIYDDGAMYCESKHLTPVPHPRNDPEAVAMIEAAKLN